MARKGLVSYDMSDDSDDGVGPVVSPKPTFSSGIVVSLAPHIDHKMALSQPNIIDPKTKELFYNPKYEELCRPAVGPANPNMSQARAMIKNTFTGYVEEGQLSEFQFEDQRRTFLSRGYAMDPSMTGVLGPNSFIGDVSKAIASNGDTVATAATLIRPADKRKRAAGTNDPSDIATYEGPWAKFHDEALIAKPSEEQSGILASWHKEEEGPAAKKVFKENTSEKTTLHIKEEFDYQGRSFMFPPQDQGVKFGEPPERCFLPKKLIHTWTASTKGVSAIRFIPNTAHLLLSAGMDSKVKIFETYGDRRLLRSYLGHTQAVRDITFNNDGTKFLSAGYDRMVRLWDTETGKCISRFTNKKIPYCVKFHPEKQNLFVAGTSDKKILCFDINSGEIVQEYDRHMGAVNTITFVEEGRRMVTTSDDKSIRVWEWDIPVDMKYIADPGMHSMPAVAVHPNAKYMILQSMDNTIVTFGARDRFRANPKKKFKGHLVAGYACGLTFSPCGSYVLSGDSEGYCYIWDWNSCKLYSKLKAHDNVCMGVEWNPNETSKIATCGWDGLIKYWD